MHEMDGLNNVLKCNRSWNFHSLYIGNQLIHFVQNYSAAKDFTKPEGLRVADTAITASRANLPVTFQPRYWDHRHDHVPVRIERFVNERRHEGPQRRNLERVAGDGFTGRLIGPFDTVLEEKAPPASPASATFLDGHRSVGHRGVDGVTSVESKDTSRACDTYSTSNAKVSCLLCIVDHVQMYKWFSELPITISTVQLLVKVFYYVIN